MEYSSCKHQYIGSALNFKQRFRVHKSNIKTNKDCCGTAWHFNSICCHPVNPLLKSPAIGNPSCLL